MSVRTICCLVALALGAAAGGAEVAPGPAPEELAVVGVHVVPMDSERVLRDQAVVVRNGRIAAIGPRGEVAVPEGAAVVDGAGRYLLPGLFDTHVHLYDEERPEHLLLYLAQGVLTVQSMNGAPWRLEMRRQVASGELAGPRILTTGPTTARVRVDSPERAEAVVREQKRAGYDAIKMYGDGSRSMTAETYAKVIETAHEVGLRVVGHAPRNHPFSLVLEHGQDSIDHMEEILYTEESLAPIVGPMVAFQFGRSTREEAEAALAAIDDLAAAAGPAAAALARRVREAGLAVTPTLVAFETIWRQTTDEFPRLAEAPEMRFISPMTRADWGPGLNRYRSGGWLENLDLVERVLARGLELQKILVDAFHREGVRLMTGTDAPLTYVFPGSSLHRELALFVASGLTPYAALRAATAEPAAELGLGDELGTIELGKLAELVLVDGDPLADVANARRVAGVVVRGRYLPSAALDRGLEELAAAYLPLEAPIAAVTAAYRVEDAPAVLAAWAAAEDPPAALGDFVEDLVNRLGYRRLRNDGDAAAAREILRANAEAFPGSANVWDSLAEAEMHLGAIEESAAHYARSLELDAGNDHAARRLEWLAVARAASPAPPPPPAAELAALAGGYGERRVALRDGELFYRRGEGAERRLVYLGADTWALEGMHDFRLRFERDAGGRPVKIVGLYVEGHSDESPRDD